MLINTNMEVILKGKDWISDYIIFKRDNGYFMAHFIKELGLNPTVSLTKKDVDKIIKSQP